MSIKTYLILINNYNLLHISLLALLTVSSIIMIYELFLHATKIKLLGRLSIWFIVWVLTNVTLVVMPSKDAMLMIVASKVGKLIIANPDASPLDVKLYNDIIHQLNDYDTY